MTSDLVAGLRRGDAAAFDTVYEQFGDKIYNFLYRLAGRRDLADDLFQETFLKLARHAASLREDTELGAWLYTVARNAFRSHRRAAVLDGARVRELGDEPAPPGIAPDRAAEARREVAALERALAALKPDFREVIVLICIEGMDAKEAAAVLGLTHEALRQRLSRARALLAAELDAPARAGGAA